jgi:aldoxime dehydratase
MSKELNGSSSLISLTPSPRNMPPDWTPPAPAWAVSFAQQSTPVVMAYFGTQLESHHQERCAPQMHEFFECADAPENFESARFVDRTGCSSLVTAAYWTDPAMYERWQEKSGFTAWWSDPARMSDHQGHFREILTVPPNRFETIFSHGIVVGVAKTGSAVVGPIREHNYWGSMRDRIQASAHDDLRSGYGERLPHLGAIATLGRRLRVEAPENLAIIRSGQDWTNCRGAELAEYNDSVRPALLEGMNFLRDNPDATGCCDLRFAEEIDHDGALLKRTFGLGYFLTLGHLEKWAATHPTHLAIFSRFLTMVRQHGADLKLKLWHEVSVLPAAGQVFEYINCHPGTGLLPYFPAEEC